MGLRRFFTLFGLAWQYARSFLLGATIVLFVTFIVFPRIITKTNLHFIDLLVEDKQRQVTWTFWFFLFLMNLSDTLGKWIAGRTFASTSDRLGYILTYLRFIFLLTCNLIKFKLGPDWLLGSIQGDWFKLLNLILFGVSNGFCLSIMAIKSRSRVPQEKQKEIGIFVGIFITLGLVLGGLVAIPADFTTK